MFAGECAGVAEQVERAAHCHREWGHAACSGDRRGGGCGWGCHQRPRATGGDHCTAELAGTHQTELRERARAKLHHAGCLRGHPKHQPQGRSANDTQTHNLVYSAVQQDENVSSRRYI